MPEPTSSGERKPTLCDKCGRDAQLHVGERPEGVCALTASQVYVQDLEEVPVELASEGDVRTLAALLDSGWDEEGAAAGDYSEATLRRLRQALGLAGLRLTPIRVRRRSRPHGDGSLDLSQVSRRTVEERDDWIDQLAIEVGRLRAVASAAESEDGKRVDALEALAGPHHAVIVCASAVPGEEFVSVQRIDQWRNPHETQWCHEAKDLRGAIDLVRTQVAGI